MWIWDFWEIGTGSTIALEVNDWLLANDPGGFVMVRASVILARCAEPEKARALIYRRQKCRRLIIV